MIELMFAIVGVLATGLLASLGGMIVIDALNAFLYTRGK